MSTKSTIAYDDDFHFYHECFDDRNVYLRLSGVEFEAGQNYVMVPIPMHIWEVIRTLAAPNLSLADKTDDEMQSLAEQHVDTDIAFYGEHKDSEFVRRMYERATRPRDEQVAQALQQLNEQRAEQQEICEAVEAIRKKNQPKGPAV